MIGRREVISGLAAAVALGKGPALGQQKNLFSFGGFDTSAMSGRVESQNGSFGLDATDVLRASSVLAGTPLYCGRYFSGTSSERTLCETRDIGILRRFQIPMLLIARQTKTIGKSNKGDAVKHAGKNISEFLRIFNSTAYGKAILKQLKLQQQVLPHFSTRFFLDCEDEPGLSAEYYEGWVEGLSAASEAAGIRFSPAAYLPDGNSKTLETLNNAASRNPESCSGLWLARYDYHEGARALGCKPFGSNLDVTTKVKSNIPILLHQYAECDDRIDISYLDRSAKPLPFFLTLVRTWQLESPEQTFKQFGLAMK